MKALLATLLLLAAAPALAANADAPNKNVDKTNDAGGPTGNDRTDKLNQQQAAQPSTTQQPATQPAPTRK